MEKKSKEKIKRLPGLNARGHQPIEFEESPELPCITDHVKVEEALRASETKFRTLADTTTAAIFIYQGNKFRYVNPGLEKLTGYSNEDLLKMNFWDFAHPDFANIIRKRGLARQKKGESLPLKYEFKIMTKAGKERWVETNPAYFEYEGKPAAIATAFDITDRKNAERDLKESERRLSDIINFLPDATFVIDSGGKVTAWNQAMEDLTGIKAESILGKGNYEYALPFYGQRIPILIDMVLMPDKEIPKKYAIQRNDDRKLVGEAYMPHLKGGGAYFLATAAPLYDSEGHIIGAIETTRDITQRKKAEEALERTLDDLERRVKIRTVELSDANELLKLEIRERKKIARSLRKRERELNEKSDTLERVNIALTVLLKRREEDKAELEERVLSNVKELVLPYLDKLKKMRLNSGQMDYVNIIESHLDEVVSPFLINLKSKYFNLTPREIEVANLIKEGKTTKDMAELLGCSCPAVNFHRFNIRKKFGMKDKKANLRSHLLSLS